jgi:sulfite reductase (NADPH) hemoprotein beta-component
MLRVKIPQGILTATQVETMADVAEQYARGFAHVTTRQNIQFHFLKLSDVETVMRRFADEGITTREACGNSVRNITACPFAGVSADEVFDVTPYAEALTRFLLRHPLAAILPRKFKIGFEGCADDHALVCINDLGWTASIREADGRNTRGFRLTVGGGTSILPVTGKTLFEFLPAGEMLNVAEAILRVYQRLGDHQHRHRNRMKFLIKTLGWERWRGEVLEELERVRAEGNRTLPFDPESPAVEPPPDWTADRAPGAAAIRALVDASPVKGPGIRPVFEIAEASAERLACWQSTNTRPQRQAGYVVAFVRLPLGDITAGQLRAIAALSRAYGDGSVRLTLDQNIFLRWVPVGAVAGLFAGLAAAGLAEPGAGTVADVTSCPGAETCRLAVTQSRGLGRLLGETLSRRPDLVREAAEASIKISGCPNGCGQHHVATIGFQGSVRKVDGQAVPQYFVMVGGRADRTGAAFARLAAKIPARRVGAALERLLDWYVDARFEGESPRVFFARVSPAEIKVRLSDLEEFSAAGASSDDYIDLGESTTFTPEVMEGECAT